MSLESVKAELEKDLKKVVSEEELNELRNKYLSKKGLISELGSEIKNVSNDKKKEFGQKFYPHHLNHFVPKCNIKQERK